MKSARSGIDTGRLSQAVKRPGVDPRSWIVTGIVKALGIDPKEGVFADVAFEPDGNEETCYVAVPYAGSTGGVGWGEWTPLEVGDTVIVGVPAGDTNMGPVVLGRYWNAGDPPPPYIMAGDADGNGQADPTKDRWIILKPGTKWILIADNSALQIEPEQVTVASPSVILGDQSATALAHADETKAAINAIVTVLQGIGAAIDLKNTNTPGPVTTADLVAFFSTAFKTGLTSALKVPLQTLPTTKVKGT